MKRKKQAAYRGADSSGSGVVKFTISGESVAAVEEAVRRLGGHVDECTCSSSPEDGVSVSVVGLAKMQMDSSWKDGRK